MRKRVKRVRHSDLDGLDWHQMPQDGGQIISVTYAVSGDYLYRREIDQSDGSVTITGAEIESMDDFEPWNGLLPTTGGETKVYPDDVADIMDVIESFGERFCGVNVEDEALGWIENGITDPAVVGIWCEIGVWNQLVAAQFIEAGLTPEQVLFGSENLLMDLGEHEEARDHYTDGDPIYSVCNDDTDIEILIAATRR